MWEVNNVCNGGIELLAALRSIESVQPSKGISYDWAASMFPYPTDAETIKPLKQKNE